MANDLINDAKSIQRGLRKANIDLFPQSLFLRCGHLEIYSDGKPQNTKIFIDNVQVTGVFSCHINLNTQRMCKAELGVFLDECNLKAEAKRKE
jgi:hypothetical protein